MEQSPSSEAKRLSPSQEIPHILWNPKFHYRTHKCLPPVPILIRSNLVHTSPSHIFKRYFNIISHLLLGLPRSPFPTGLLTNILHLSSPPYVAHTPLISSFLFDQRIIFSEYRLQSSSICSLLKLHTKVWLKTDLLLLQHRAVSCNHNKVHPITDHKGPEGE